MPDRASERRQFFQLAVPYYVLALVEFFDRTEGDYWYTEEDINRQFQPYVVTGDLIERAAAICSEAGLVEMSKSELAPTLFSRGTATPEARKNFEKGFEIFALYRRVAERDTWLSAAMKRVNQRWPEIEAIPADEDEGTAWYPIPIEREEPLLKQVIADLDTAIDVIQTKNNEYRATYPGEYSYVLDSLKAFQKRLTEDTHIAWTYVKEFALEPLAVVIRRFSDDTPCGGAAIKVRDAILNWLRERVGDVLGVRLT